MKGTKGAIWRGLAFITILALILGALPLTPTALGAPGDTKGEAIHLWGQGDSTKSLPRTLAPSQTSWYHVLTSSTSPNIQLGLTAFAGSVFDVYFGSETFARIASVTLFTIPGGLAGDWHIQVRAGPTGDNITITATPGAGGPGPSPSPSPTVTVTPGEGSSRQSPKQLNVGQSIDNETLAIMISRWYFLDFNGNQQVNVEIIGPNDIQMNVYRGSNTFQEPGGSFVRFFTLNQGSFNAGQYFFEVRSSMGGTFSIAARTTAAGNPGDSRLNPQVLTGTLPINVNMGAPNPPSKWFSREVTQTLDLEISVSTPDPMVQLWVYLGTSTSPAPLPGQGTKLVIIKQGGTLGNYIFEVRNVQVVSFQITLRAPLAAGACTQSSPCVLNANAPTHGNVAPNPTNLPAMNQWFQFVKPADQRAKVELRSPSASLFMNVRAYALDSAPIATSVRFYPLGDANYYYFEVTGGFQGGDFDIEVRTESAETALGPGGGNSQTTAAGLETGDVRVGLLGADTSTWFRFGFFGEPVLITVTTELTGPVGMSVFFGYSPMPLTTITSTVGTPAGFPLGANSSRGNYFVRVNGGPNGGRYNLQVKRTGPTATEGSSQSTAIPITTTEALGTFTGNKVWFSYDYQVSNQPVNIEMSDGAGLVFDVFFGLSPAPIGTSHPASPKQAFTISSPNTGLYYIAVRPMGYMPPGGAGIPVKMTATAGIKQELGPPGSQNNPDELKDDQEVRSFLQPQQSWWYSYDIPEGKKVEIVLTQGDKGIALNIFGNDPSPIAPGVRSWMVPPFFGQPTVFINVTAPFGGGYALVARTASAEAGDGSSREKAIQLPAEVVIQGTVTGASRKWFVYQHSGATASFMLEKRLSPTNIIPHPEVKMDVFVGESNFPQPGSGSNSGFVGGGTPPGPIFIAVYRSGGGATVDFDIRATTQVQYGGPPPGEGGFEQPSTSLKAGVYDCESPTTLVPRARVAILYSGDVLTRVLALTGTIDLAPSALPNGGKDGHYDLRGLPPRPDEPDVTYGVNCAPGFMVGIDISSGMVSPMGDPQVGQHLILEAVQLKGTVKDPDGNPVRQARVKAVPDFGGAAGGFGAASVSAAQFGGGFGGGGGESEEVVVKTNAQGLYRMGGFMPGIPYLIVAYPPEPEDGGPGDFAQSKPEKKRFTGKGFFEGGFPGFPGGPGGGYGYGGYQSIGLAASGAKVKAAAEPETANLTLTTPNVLGKVTNPAGDAVAGARVVAEEEFAATFGPTMGPPSTSVTIEGFSKTDGTYRLGALSSGKTYKVIAKPPKTGANSGFKASQPKRVSYAGTQLTGVDLALTSGQITVTVTSGGVGIPGAKVDLFSIGSFGPGVFYQDDTDSNGRVTFGGLADGLYNVSAFPPPDPKYFNLAPSAPQQTKISSGAASPSSVTFNLGAATLTGIVYKSDGSTPATSGVSVEIFKTDFTYHYGVGVNEQGAFAAGGMPAGNYKVQAKIRGGFGFGEQTQDTDSVARDVTIDASGNPDSSWDGKLVLTKPQLTIYVVDTKDNPPSFPVHIQPFPRGTELTGGPTGEPIGEGTETNPGTGQALLGGLDQGNYWLQVFLPPMLPFAQPDAQAITVTQTLTQTVADPSRLTFELKAPMKKITGTVFKADGTKVTNAGVHGFREDGSGNADAFTDSIGAYELKLAKGGVWLLVLFPMFGGPGGKGGASAQESRSIKQAQMELDWIFTEEPRRVEFKELDTVEETIKDVMFTVGRAGALVKGKVLREKDNSPPDLGTTFVDVRDEQGVGNGVPLSEDGTFTVAVPGGLTARVRVFSKDSSLSQKGEPPYVETKDDVTKDVGTIYLSQLALSISGKVVIAGATDLGGLPVGVENMEVTAFKEGGLGFAKTTSSTGGVFTLAVSAGDWRLKARPGKDSKYTPKGRPVEVEVETESVSGVVLEVQAADGEINAKLTTTSQTVDTKQLYGFGFALDKNRSLVAGTPMERGSFKLRVPKGVTYTVGVNFPPGLEYGVTPATADLTTASAVTVTLPVEVADGNIVGSWVDTAGNNVSNLDATVFGTGEKGFKSVALESGGDFTLRVVVGTWFLGGKVNTAGYVLKVPSNNRVDVTPQKKTVVLKSDQYFVVQRASGKVVGTVKDPSGNGMVARVWAETKPITATDAPRLVADTLSGSNGAYEMNAPAGTYVIRAAVPPEKGFLPPLPIQTDVPNTGAVTVDFQFRAPQATISGNVSGPGAATALVTAYSDKGAWSSTTVSPTAPVSYTLNASTNDTWHLLATSSVSSTVYRSDPKTVEVGTTNVTGLRRIRSAATDLLLKPVTAISLPSGGSVTFDSTSMQVIALDDGMQVTIPGGALATSGDVTVYAIPTEKLTSQPSAQAKLIGYNLQAFDSNNVLIKKFKQSVTMRVPYPDDATLATLGIDEAMLKPMLYDTTSGSWVVAEPFSQDTDYNVFIITTDHFTIFAGILTAGAAETGASVVRIYVPYLSKQYSGGW